MEYEKCVLFRICKSCIHKKNNFDKFLTEKEHGFTKAVVSIIVTVMARVIPWASS